MEQIQKTLTDEDFYDIEVKDKEALLDLIYGCRDEKTREEAYKGGKSNGDLFMDFVNEVIEEWNNNKELYEDDKYHFISEFVDGKVEIYTTSLFKWYSEGADRFYYIDDAYKEFGYNEERGIIGLLQQGQYRFLEEIVNKILDKAEEKDLI